MKFPNAHKGVKKLFICELIGVVATLLAIATAVLAAIGLKDSSVLAAAGAMALSSVIVLIVLFVLQLVGLHQAGKDELQIKYAFCITVLGVILAIVSSILTNFNGRGIELAKTFVDAAVKVSQLLAGYYVLMGISALAGKLKDVAMEKKGRALANWVVFFFFVSIVFNILSTVLLPHSPEWLKVTLGVLVIVASVVELIVYVVTFFYYAKAVKMLKK